MEKYTGLAGWLIESNEMVTKFAFFINTGPRSADGNTKNDTIQTTHFRSENSMLKK